MAHFQPGSAHYFGQSAINPLCAHTDYLHWLLRHPTKIYPHPMAFQQGLKTFHLALDDGLSASWASAAVPRL